MIILTPCQDDLYFSMTILQPLSDVCMGTHERQLRDIGTRRLNTTGRASCSVTNLNMAVYQVPYSG